MPASENCALAGPHTSSRSVSAAMMLSGACGAATAERLGCGVADCVAPCRVPLCSITGELHLGIMPCRAHRVRWRPFLHLG